MELYNFRGRALRIAIGTVLIFLFWGGGAQALSNPGGGSWQYYKDITISNTGGALSDYQVLVTFTSSNFPTNAQSSGADIRFTDAGGAELSYWIESWDYAGRSARVWVNVTSITASGSTSIRMWYGNPSASSSSSGGATFDLYDDFAGTSLDVNKWSSSGTISLSNGELSLYGLGWIKSKAEFGENIIEEARSKAGGGVGYYIGFRNDAVTKYITVRGSNGADPFHGDTSNGITSHLYPQIAPYDTVYHLWKLEKNGITSAKIYQDDVLKVTLTADLPSASGLKAFLLGGEYPTGTYYYTYIDWVRIRKYASPEPSVSVGAEQANSGLVGYWSFDGNAQDSSGSGNHGTISGAAFVQGVSGQALSFGGNDYVEVPDSDSLDLNGAFTIEAWVNLQADHSSSTATMIRKPGNFLLELGDSGNNRPTFSFNTDIPNNNIYSSEIPKYGWHHLVGIYDGSAMKLYMDGGLVSSILILVSIYPLG